MSALIKEWIPTVKAKSQVILELNLYLFFSETTLHFIHTSQLETNPLEKPDFSPQTPKNRPNQMEVSIKLIVAVISRSTLHKNTHAFIN